MRQLLRTTTAYRAMAQGDLRTVLVLFPDGKYLRMLLKECAKRFFGAEDGSRTAALIEKEAFSDCPIFPAEGGKLTADDCGRIVEEGPSCKRAGGASVNASVNTSAMPQSTRRKRTPSPTASSPPPRTFAVFVTHVRFFVLRRKALRTVPLTASTPADPARRAPTTARNPTSGEG